MECNFLALNCLSRTQPNQAPFGGHMSERKKERKKTNRKNMHSGTPSHGGLFENQTRDWIDWVKTEWYSGGPNGVRLWHVRNVIGSRCRANKLSSVRLLCRLHLYFVSMLSTRVFVCIEFFILFSFFSSFCFYIRNMCINLACSIHVRSIDVGQYNIANRLVSSGGFV